MKKMLRLRGKTYYARIRLNPKHRDFEQSLKT